MSVTVQYTKAHRLVLSGLDCDCGREHRPITQDIYMDRGILRHLPAILKRREVGGRALLVCDGNTDRAAGKRVEEILNAARVPLKKVVLERPGHLLIDEAALGELLMGMPLDTEWFLGVGAGTVNGLCRLAAALTERPFVCVPTAPSTDSYPLGFGQALCKNQWVELRLNTPELVICDLDVLCAAPAPLRQAGFGRMLSAFLAQVDWLAAHLAQGEPLCPQCAAMPAQAAERLLAVTQAAGGEDEHWLRALMEALLVAGLAQDICFSCRPMASAAQVAAGKWLYPPQGALKADDGLAQGVAALLLWPRYLDFARRGPQEGPLKAHYAILQGAIAQLPDLGRVRTLMEKMGCPTQAGQLGLDMARVQEGLEAAIAASPILHV